MTTREFMRYDTEGHVAIITLARPDKLNALNTGLQDELNQAVDETRRNDDLRVLIITGKGRGFCSGADLTAAGGGEAGESTQDQKLDPYGWVGKQALTLYGCDKPIIAAVNGVAAGAGMSVALAADLRVGSDLARFKTVFIERNLSPDSGLSFFLPRIVGQSRAADLIYTSRTVDAEEAYRIGLLDRLVDHARLMDEALALANQIAAWPPIALRVSKRVLQHNIEAPLESALQYELASLAFGRRAVSDQRESLASFLEKRAPRYTGT